jgi:hypothetical protein
MLEGINLLAGRQIVNLQFDPVHSFTQLTKTATIHTVPLVQARDDILKLGIKRALISVQMSLHLCTVLIPLLHLEHWELLEDFVMRSLSSILKKEFVEVLKEVENMLCSLVLGTVGCKHTLFNSLEGFVQPAPHRSCLQELIRRFNNRAGIVVKAFARVASHGTDGLQWKL